MSAPSIRDLLDPSYIHPRRKHVLPLEQAARILAICAKDTPFRNEVIAYLELVSLEIRAAVIGEEYFKANPEEDPS